MFMAGISISLFGASNTLLISGAIMFLTAFVYLLMKE